jgi:hypothetical protein
MRRARLALILGALFAAGPAAAEFKNLQVLPKNISKDELKAVMKAQSRALGVECDHCHEMPTAEKDTDRKKIAREMMKMTAEINDKFIKDPKNKVVCETCHRGKESPDVVGK